MGGYAAAHSFQHLSYSSENNEAVFVTDLTFSSHFFLLLFFLLQATGPEEIKLTVKPRMQQEKK